MFIILVFVVALVAWALHLMEQAIERKEFSLMLAGFLVASAAAATMSVYFLMSSYMGYVSQLSHSATWVESIPVSWVEPGQAEGITWNVISDENSNFSTAPEITAPS